MASISDIANSIQQNNLTFSVFENSTGKVLIDKMKSSLVLKSFNSIEAFILETAKGKLVQIKTFESDENNVFSAEHPTMQNHAQNNFPMQQINGLAGDQGLGALNQFIYNDIKAKYDEIKEKYDDVKRDLKTEIAEHVKAKLKIATWEKEKDLDMRIHVLDKKSGLEKIAEKIPDNFGESLLGLIPMITGAGTPQATPQALAGIPEEENSEVRKNLIQFAKDKTVDEAIVGAMNGVVDGLYIDEKEAYVKDLNKLLTKYKLLQ